MMDDIVAMRARLWQISQQLARPNDDKWNAWIQFKSAERLYKRKKGAWRLAAPLRDPRDSSRKMTAEDISAWVDGQVEIQELQDDLILKEQVWLAHNDATYRLKDELDAIRSALLDSRNERKVLDQYA